MAENPEIDELIEDFADDGILDSSGAFTLDPEKAKEKLRNFSFASPYHYLLKFVQAAVASGAEAIDIRITPKRLTVSFNGQAFTEEELRSLFVHLLDEEGLTRNRRLRHLGAALRGAVAMEPDNLSFDSWSGTGGTRRLWDGQGWRSESFESHSHTSINRFSLERTFTQTLGKGSSNIKSLFDKDFQDSEESVIRARCQFSPIPISLDREPIPREPFGAARYPGYDIHQDEHPGESVPPPYIDRERLVQGLVAPNHHLVESFGLEYAVSDSSLRAPSQSQATIRVPDIEDHPCRYMMAIRAHLDESRLVLVEDGVTLNDGPFDFGYPGVLAVCSAVSFRKDLTGFQVILDERYAELMKELLTKSQEMREQALDSLALFPHREMVEARLS